MEYYDSQYRISQIHHSWSNYQEYLKSLDDESLLDTYKWVMSNYEESGD